MLFREIIAVYCENHAEHTNTLCVQNDEVCNIKTGGTYIFNTVRLTSTFAARNIQLNVCKTGIRELEI
jgi:hypothetical protein